MAEQVNAADRKQVTDAKRREKSLEEREIGDFRTIVATRAGRRFIWRYLGRCGVFESSFIPEQKEAATFFREGERNIGLQLLAEINRAQPEAYALMLKEAKEEELKDV